MFPKANELQFQLMEKLKEYNGRGGEEFLASGCSPAEVVLVDDAVQGPWHVVQVVEICVYRQRIFFYKGEENGVGTEMSVV